MLKKGIRTNGINVIRRAVADAERMNYPVDIEALARRLLCPVSTVQSFVDKFSSAADPEPEDEDEDE